MFYDDNVLFVHVSKTGGTSIEELFRKNSIPIEDVIDLHDTLFAAKRQLPQNIFNTRFKFGFVRNPFDRELSNWFWHTRGNCNYDIDFDRWVKWRYSENEEENPGVTYDFMGGQNDYFYQKGFARNPQLGFFLDAENYFLSDFIGRMETFQEDWEFVAKKFGYPTTLPHEYESRNRKKDYRPYYTTELIDIISKYHRWDLEVFNYDFENGMLSKEINVEKAKGFDFRLTDNYNYFYG